MSETVVLLSGGVGSWAAARRLVDAGETIVPLFTDTQIEDPSLYRFLNDCEADLDTEIVHIEDGRTPWEVFHDEGMIGNTRADLCSRILKRDLARDWIDAHYPDGTTVAMGIDWQEVHRYERARSRWLPHELIAPLTEPPLIDKQEMIADARSRGMRIPDLYELGFPHNNCGGFCIKQGQGAFIKLLQTMPDRYAHHEAQEERFRAETGKDVSVLRDRRGGETKPLTLRQLREEYESGGTQLDLFDLGGCGCMIG